MYSIYNHYLKLIRDATGINEMMDGTTPKGETLVGVQQNAIKAGNNAIYNITDCSMVLFKRVCSDIIKCVQILPQESVIFNAYKEAIGSANMEVLSSFDDMPMYNFGVIVEDAIAIRELKNVDQAERLLVVRRKKRKAEAQQLQQAQAQQQQQMAMQQQQATAQMAAQQAQMEAQIEAQKIQLKAQSEVQVATALHEFRKEIEMIRAQATLGFKTDDQEFKEKIEVLKEDRKDDRVKKQATEQSKLMSQRKGERGELPEIQKEKSINEIFNL